RAAPPTRRPPRSVSRPRLRSRSVAPLPSSFPSTQAVSRWQANVASMTMLLHSTPASPTGSKPLQECRQPSSAHETLDSRQRRLRRRGKWGPRRAGRAKRRQLEEAPARRLARVELEGPVGTGDEQRRHLGLERGGDDDLLHEVHVQANAQLLLHLAPR